MEKAGVLRTKLPSLATLKNQIRVLQ
jgi:hypothetical protein